MNDKELMDLQRGTQSYYEKNGYENPYNGLDKLKVEDIQDKKIYALAIDKQIDALNKGEEVNIEYYFDQETYDKFVDPVTKEFDAKKLSQALQVGPFHNKKLMPDGHAEYRYSIVCFERNKDIRTPVGNVSENNHFGPGGAHQCFIPKEELDRMRRDGTLVYSQSDSLIHKGKNYKISYDEYDLIDKISQNRKDNCRDNNLLHPEQSVCDQGFKKAKPLPGIPFDKEGLSKSLETTKEVSNLSIVGTNTNLSKSGKEIPQSCNSGRTSLSERMKHANEKTTEREKINPKSISKTKEKQEMSM